MPIPLERRSARAILLNGTGCVLLIRFSVMRDGGQFVFWAPPGGAVEFNETELDAVKRELKEELAIDVPLVGPVHSSLDRFIHKGVLVENTDIFFAGRFDQAAPRLHATAEDERNAMQETRWWASDQLDRTTENIFPRDLAMVIRRLM